MKKKTFERGMGIIASVFQDKTIDMDIYWDFLKDLEDDCFIQAVNIFCYSEAQIYPGTNIIAKLREIAQDEDTKNVALAWAEVMVEISRTGHNGIPKFSDNIIEQAVTCLGWKNICLSENISIERAHFFKVYPQLINRKKIDTLKIGAKNSEINKLTKDTGICKV